MASFVLLSEPVSLDERRKVMSNWIPVTERLPEVSGRYLVTHNGHVINLWWFDGVHDVDDPERHYDDIDYVVYPGYKGWVDWYTYEDDGQYAPHITHELITAWMPMPEPYGKGEK